jgi:hypothetical protein
MKIKLAALLAATLLTLAGCGSSSNSTNTTNSSNASNANKAANTTSSTTATPDPNIVKANANASDETGGTKEGCKCSAVGMKCSTKAGEKGCCGKDGECSTMVDGKSSCCAGKGSEDAACCSTAGKMAEGGKMDDKNACNPGEKPATAPAAGKKG